MNKVRVLILASLAVLAAACSSTPPQPAAPKAPDLSGNWVLTIESQMGAQDSQMTMTQTGNQLAGTITGQAGTVPYTGTLDGNAVAFSFTINAQGMELKIDQVGTLEGDALMKGKSIFGQFGEGTFTAKKAP